MDSKLCCIAPPRAQSPEDGPRPVVRPWKSLANIRHPFSHEKQPFQGATADHLEKPFAFEPSDGMELQRIFAVASLPDNHPDALKFPGRKPGVDETIVCSPSFTNKLRRQLSRKSLGSRRYGSRYSKSGKRSTYTNGWHSSTLEAQAENSPDPLSPDGGDLCGYDADALCLDINESRLGSLLLHDVALNDFGGSREHDDEDRVQDFLGLCAPRTYHPDLLFSSRSVSVPNHSPLPSRMQQIRRSRSASDLESIKFLLEVLPVRQPQPDFFGLHGSWRLSSLNSSIPLSPRSSNLTTVRGRPTAVSTICHAPDIQFGPSRSSYNPTVRRTPPPSAITSTQTATLALPKHLSLAQLQAAEITDRLSNDSLHLYNMQISRHLRSQSNLSETSSLGLVGRTWSQHIVSQASLTGLLLSSTNLRHRRHMSGSGLASSGIPSLWGKVVEDNSSSIYSGRPSTSADPHGPSTVELPYIIPCDQVKEKSICSCEQLPQLSNLQEPFSDGIHMMPLETSDLKLTSVPPAMQMKLSSDLIQDTATDQSPCTRREEQSSSSLTKSSSSGSLGKLSKFKEDLVVSSPDKPTKKRSSMLRIFFPKLSKAKCRSVSIPLLRDKSGIPAIYYDGPSDDPDTLLQVPNGSSMAHRSGRSISLVDVPNEQSVSATSSNSLAVPSSVQHRRSPADYERSLSVVGDDRRRRSTINMPSVQELQPQPEQIEDIEPFDHALHRAAPLFGNRKKVAENVLMERALHVHQAEKAVLFRSSSKKIDMNTESTTNLPVFNMPFGASASSTPVRMPPSVDELDPLDTEGSKCARRSQSMQHLRPRIGSSARSHVFGKKPSTTSTVNTSATNGRLRAATPLAGWSRFPSHTREKRSGSAGKKDDVVARDFAYAEEASEEGEPDSYNFSAPAKDDRNSHLLVSKKRPWVAKSRSMTFGGVMRYWSDLLTSSAARNRRSSIAIAGRLEHPELEILPPIFPAHTPHLASPTHGHSRTHLAHLVDHVKAGIEEGGHHLRRETKEALTHLPLHHHQRHNGSPRDSESDGTSGASSTSSDDQASSGAKDETTSPDEQLQAAAQQPFSFDGTSEQPLADPKPSPTARRLSRMYQAYVQLPTSLDANAVAKETNQSDDHTNETTKLVDAATLDALEGRSNEEFGRFLTVPSPKTRQRTPSPRIRRFPSVTVVDDRKGHWRSVSLVSVQSGASSGKSLRNSTKNLLDLLKEAENSEREKLMRAAEDFGKEIGVAV